MKQPSDINILVGCEESQAVCIAFRERGFNAFSCDLQDCSGGHPEWHIKGNIREFFMWPHHDKSKKFLKKWDLVIAHPPCTFIANSGARWLFDENGNKNQTRWDGLRLAISFFNSFKHLYEESIILHLAIENPIPHKYARDGYDDVLAKKGIGLYDQIIQPYYFGRMEMRRTCLWLYGLPKLIHTNNVYDEMMKLPYKDRAKVHCCSPGIERGKIRSKTIPEYAKAMAQQWGNYLLNEL